MPNARDKALEYLSRFARTERQLADYLKRKDYPDEEIKETLAFLRDRSLVNDRAFADSYIDSRMRRLDGPLKIKQLLFQKGIAPALADELLRAAYPFEIQLENVKLLIEKKPKLAGPSGRKKLMSFIASRGFPRYVIIHALQAANG